MVLTSSFGSGSSEQVIAFSLCLLLSLPVVIKEGVVFLTSSLRWLPPLTNPPPKRREGGGDEAENSEGEGPLPPGVVFQLPDRQGVGSYPTELLLLTTMDRVVPTPP